MHPERHHRGLVRGERGQRRLRAVAARPVGVRRGVGGGRPERWPATSRWPTTGSTSTTWSAQDGAGSTSFEADAQPAGRLDRLRSAARQPGQRERLAYGQRGRRPLHRRQRRGGAGPAAGDHRLPRRRPRPLPVRGGRRHRRQRPGDRLRPGEPDPTDLRAGLVQPARRQHLGGRARARPPVGRRRPGARGLAAHLAQRRIRQLHGVALVGGRRWGHRPGDLRLLRPHPRRRSVLDHGDRRSRSGPHLRRAGLRPRRHDPPCPAHRDRRRGLLPAPEALDGPAVGRQRPHRRVHRAGRAGLG